MINMILNSKVAIIAKEAQDKKNNNYKKSI